MAAPPSVENLLELTATRVSKMEHSTFFIDNLPKESVYLNTHPEPEIRLRKTGGTTGHRAQGDNYISYKLEIAAVNINYSIYIMPAADSPAKNQQALARAIRWFIKNYNNGSVFTREEPAI